MLQDLAQALRANQTLKVLHIQLNKLGDLGCKARSSRQYAKRHSIRLAASSFTLHDFGQALDRQSEALEDLDIEDNEGEADFFGFNMCKSVSNPLVDRHGSKRRPVWESFCL